MFTQVSATDSDSGGDGDFTYSITSGDPNAQFIINATTGEISIAKQLLPNTVFVLVVAATDQASSNVLSSAINVTVSGKIF